MEVDENTDVRDDVQDDDGPKDRESLLKESLDDWDNRDGDDDDDDGDTESRLKKSLDDWEGKQRPAFDDDPEPEPDPRADEIAELQGRIESLEGDMSGATLRAEAGDEAIAFYDEVQERMDRHDAGRLLDHLADETGCDRHVLDMELKMKLLEDPELRAAADDRFHNPDRFNAMVSELEDDLREKHPNDLRDHGLASAVRAARSASSSSADHGEFSELDWSRMSNQEFAQQSRKVLSAHKAGRLRGKARRGGGWSTSPE